MMGGRRSREKGARGERAVVSVLKLIFPDARRGRQYDSARECDVEGTPIRFEVKTFKNWPDAHAALEQVTNDGDKHGDERPVAVVHKKDRVPYLLTMPLTDFVKAWEENVWSPPEDNVVELFAPLEADDE